MILRPAFLDDIQTLGALGRDSFCAAFAHLYDPADLNSFLATHYADAKVAHEIAADGFIHQLAADEERLLGYCKLAWPSGYGEHSQARNPITLEQLYTQPDVTGRGIGAALMDWAIATARERGHDAILLSVWSENYGAQRFYQRYGFGKIADIDFWVGNHRDDEFLYEVRL